MSEIDLEDFLNGKLSVWCDNPSEISELRNCLSAHGINVNKIYNLHHASIRIDPFKRVPSAEYAMLNPEWHVRNHFVERWMYFADFMASCGLSEPQINITTLDDFV